MLCEVTTIYQLNLFNKFITTTRLNATGAKHDKNLAKFRLRAQMYNLTINEEKSKFKVRELKFLGHRFSDGKVHTDESRMKPLLEFPVPKTLKELNRIVGMNV